MKGLVMERIQLIILMLGLCSSLAAAATSNVNYIDINVEQQFQQQQEQKWWKKMFQGPASSSSSSHVNPVGSSSVIFPLYGNIYPIGYYYVEVMIGNPPKPYFLDPDTGSDLTWLQCDAPCVHCTKSPHELYMPNNDLVLCKDRLCAAVHEKEEEHKCEDDNDQCDYEVEYADGGSSLGVLLKDIFLLNFTTGIRHTSPLSLGCGYDQIPGGNHHPLDGVLGLGKGKSSIVSQLRGNGLLKNVVGHCFSSTGGGFIFFGDDIYDSSRVLWTTMSRDRIKHYSPGFAELILGGKSSGLKNLVFIFDSGSSYTYLNSHTYHTLLSFVKKELRGKPLKEATDDQTLPLCWRGKKAFKHIKEVKKYFKPLALSFNNGWRSRKPQFEIPPEAYLIISSKGSVCLGVLNGTEVGLHNYNIIGDITMQDKMVIYDNEKHAIGWLPANCGRAPKSPDISF